jgi:phosphinothricin acetyltransferase
LLDIQGRIRSTLTVLPWLVIEHSGKVLGYAYAGRHRDRAAYRWSVDVTVYVHQRARQKTDWYSPISHTSPPTRNSGFYRAYAGITLPNVASIRLHERMGFQTVGIYHGVGYKLGVWHDVQWVEATLHNGNAGPSDPIVISQIRPEYWKDAISKGQAVFA